MPEDYEDFKSNVTTTMTDDFFLKGFTPEFVEDFVQTVLPELMDVAFSYGRKEYE